MTRSCADAAVVLGQMALDAKHNDPRTARCWRSWRARASEPDMRAGAFLKVAELYAEEKDYRRRGKGLYAGARPEPMDYAGEYRGLFGAARMIAKQGEYDAAHGPARRTSADNLNYKEFWGDLDVEIANVYRDRATSRRRCSSTSTWTRHMRVPSRR